MSLLTMIADNFELEPPPPLTTTTSEEEHHHNRPVKEDPDRSLDYDLSSCHDDGKGLSQPLLLEGETMEATANDAVGGGSNRDDVKLLLSFLLMLVIGTLNKIFQKLQAIVSKCCITSYHLNNHNTNFNYYTTIHTSILYQPTAHVQLPQFTQPPPKLHLRPPLLPLHPPRITLRSIPQLHPTPNIHHEQTTLCTIGILGLHHVSIIDICRGLFTRITLDFITTGSYTD